MAVWMGVDIGGTFTDIVAYDDTRSEEITHKVPSTPSNPAEAVVSGVKVLLERHAIASSAVAQLAHGTTVATNTLIERKGAKVTLITTKGFRDVLEIARQKRPVNFDFYRDYPPPVVPRWRRLEVSERVLSDGSIRVALSPAEIDRAVSAALATGADAFAICLIFSYLNPTHEQQLARALHSAAPDKFISMSADVHPEFREYERSSTTTLNAYLQPTMARYLRSLHHKLTQAIPRADLVVSQSSGGLMSIEKAKQFPIRTALSGPAAGVVGAIRAAAAANVRDVITFDMGGTSVDVALVQNLEPAQTHDKLVGGLAVRLPAVDVTTIGAGGGSITWFDRDGSLKVGPASAGANPGPACYGFGGDKATVTDANLVLGRLSPKGLLGGAMKLDHAAARRAIQPIAERLGASLEVAAHGILQIVVTNMSRVIRAISIERGYDPRLLALLAYGGAGPLHARMVASTLDIGTLFIPPKPGLLCAEGLVYSNLKEDFIRTARIRLDRADARMRIKQIIDEMCGSASRWFKAERILPETRYLRIALDVRYVSQSFEIEIPLRYDDQCFLPEIPEANEIHRAFFEAHERTYGFHNPDAPVEVVNCRLAAGGHRHRPASLRPSPPGGAPGSHYDERPVWYAPDAPIVTRIYRRDDLRPSQIVRGPAVIDQMDTTTLIFPNDTARLDAFGNLIVKVTQ
jgi:N-methylhydantoinase A